MRRYETIFIIDPDLSDEERTPLFTKLNELIPQQGGFLVKQDNWGAKSLAYEIKKKSRGYYVHLDYCGIGAVVDEIERFFRIDDRILKYMTVLLDKEVDIESIKEEMARAESEDVPSDQGEAAQDDKSYVDDAAYDEPEIEADSEITPLESNEEEE